MTYYEIYIPICFYFNYVASALNAMISSDLHSNMFLF